MGNSVCSMVKHIMGGGTSDPIVNRTLLVQLPKVQRPERISQFRLIRLYTIAYKIGTKTVVNRLRPLMTKLTKQNQASFVPGRYIIDNIVVAQEVH